MTIFVPMVLPRLVRSEQILVTNCHKISLSGQGSTSAQELFNKIVDNRFHLALFATDFDNLFCLEKYLSLMSKETVPILLNPHLYRCGQFSLEKTSRGQIERLNSHFSQLNLGFYWVCALFKLKIEVIS